MVLNRFVGGEMNTCYNALDRHIKCGYGEQVSLVYDSPVTNTIQKFTYQQLCDQVKCINISNFISESSSEKHE